MIGILAPVPAPRNSPTGGTAGRWPRIPDLANRRNVGQMWRDLSVYAYRIRDVAALGGGCVDVDAPRPRRYFARGDRSRKTYGNSRARRQRLFRAGTHLAKTGAPLQTAQAAMRHSDPSLTANVYTDPKLLDVAGAVASLPGLPLGEIGGTAAGVG